MKKILIRKATIEDAEYIAILARVTFTETFGKYFKDKQDLINYYDSTFSVSKLRLSIAKTNNVFWVAFCDELPVGYAKLKLISTTEFIDSNSVSQLQKIYVLNDFLSISQIEEGKTLDEAIKSAEEVLFNYSKLTPFEKQYMRRIIPFYTFMSRNLALQAKVLATNPAFVANQMKGFNAASGVADDLSTEEEEGIPDYLLKQLGVKMGTNKLGQPQILAGFGLPIEEFLNRFSGEKGFAWNTITNTIVSSNPIIKFPIEKASGVDLFYGKPIAEINKADGIKSMFDSMPKPVSDQLKNAIGYYEKEQPLYDSNGKMVGRTIKAYADPVKLHLLRNLPTARLQSTSDFLNDPGQTIESKALRFFTGAKLYSIDTEREKFFKELERKKELQKFLVDVLGYKTFESIYKPKSISNLPLEGEEDKTNNE